MAISSDEETSGTQKCVAEETVLKLRAYWSFPYLIAKKFGPRKFH